MGSEKAEKAYIGYYRRKNKYVVCTSNIVNVVERKAINETKKKISFFVFFVHASAHLSHVEFGK